MQMHAPRTHRAGTHACTCTRCLPASEAHTSSSFDPFAVPMSWQPNAGPGCRLVRCDYRGGHRLGPRRPAPDPGAHDRHARLAVRLLHSGHRDGPLFALPRRPVAPRGADAGAHGWQPLPVHRLPANPGRRELALPRHVRRRGLRWQWRLRRRRWLQQQRRWLLRGRRGQRGRRHRQRMLPERRTHGAARGRGRHHHHQRQVRALQHAVRGDARGEQGARVPGGALEACRAAAPLPNGSWQKRRQKRRRRHRLHRRRVCRVSVGGPHLVEADRPRRPAGAKRGLPARAARGGQLGGRHRVTLQEPRPRHLPLRGRRPRAQGLRQRRGGHGVWRVRAAV